MASGLCLAEKPTYNVLFGGTGHGAERLAAQPPTLQRSSKACQCWMCSTSPAWWICGRHTTSASGKRIQTSILRQTPRPWPRTSMRRTPPCARRGASPLMPSVLHHQHMTSLLVSGIGHLLGSHHCFVPDTQSAAGGRTLQAKHDYSGLRRHSVRASAHNKHHKRHLSAASARAGAALA